MVVFASRSLTDSVTYSSELRHFLFVSSANRRSLSQPLKFSRMDGNDSVDQKQDTTDMGAYVQNLLQQMQSRFQTMSDSIITKIDEMGSRIDELEQSINDLRAEMDVAKPPSPSVPSVPKDDSKSPKES